MSNAKHTPGPWFVGYRGGANCNAIMARDGGDEHHDTGICQVYGLPLHCKTQDVAGNPRYEKELANAHLVAAAPDLYEALSAFVAWCDADEEGPQYSSPDRRDGPNGEAEWRRWWNGQLELSARSHSLGSTALKKARGES
jgi:hypothetical protein